MMADQEKQDIERRLLSIRKIIKQAVQKCTRKLEKQQEEFEESRKSLWYQQIADSLLTSNSHIPRGTSRLTIVNIHTQVEESISINPKLNLKENAQLLFKKAKRGRRGEDISNRKVSETQSELVNLQQLETEIDNFLNGSATFDESLLESMEQKLSNCTTQQIAVKKSHDNSKDKIPYRHFNYEGWDIYIGKNDTQNDELTTRFASPSDIWLHVVGYAGSHVVIKRPKGSQLPPKNVMETVASLSVWFSKAKHTSFSEVHYTESRFVRKRRHAPAGEVIAERCKSIRTAPRSPHDIFPSGMYKDEA